MDTYDQLFPGIRAREATCEPGQQVRLVLTIEEAAERLGVGRTLMYALVKSGTVESVRIGRLRRVPAEALTDFVDSLRSKRSEVA